MERPRFSRRMPSIRLSSFEDRQSYEGLKGATILSDQSEKYRGWNETWFAFSDGNQWRVHIDAVVSTSTKSRWDSFTKSLPRKLENQVEHAEFQGDQKQALFFLHANWATIVNFFYTEEPESKITPEAFVRVELDKKQKIYADFIGFGPDGKIFLILGSSDNRNNNRELEKQMNVFLEKFNLPSTCVEARIAAFTQESKKDEEGRDSNGRLNIATRTFNQTSLAG